MAMPYRICGRQIGTRYVFITKVQSCTPIAIAPVFHIHLPVMRDRQWAHCTPQFHRDISPNSENKCKNTLCDNAWCGRFSLLVFGKKLWQNHGLRIIQVKKKKARETVHA
jgi:hypothetical protein